MSDDTKILSESMKLRNTDTSALKRMPTGNSSSESSAARKTIKLKPLAPRSGNSPDTATFTASSMKLPTLKPLGAASSAPVSAPTLMMGEKQKMEDQETRVPQFMSTATAPVAQIAKPHAAPAVSAKEIGSTAPVQTINLKNALGAVATASKIAQPGGTPTAAVPKIPLQKPAPAGVTGTVSMPRISMRPKSMVPPPAPSAVPEQQTTTGSVPKYVATPTGSIPKITIPEAKKPLSYMPTATSNIPKIKDAETTVPPAAEQSTNTAAVSKVSIEEAKAQSGLGASKPAIKLRPSNNMSGPVPVAAPSAPTIKLARKSDSTVSPMPSASLEDSNASSKPSPNAESQETVTLNPDTNPAVSASDKTADEPEQTNKTKESVTVTTRIPRKVGFKKPSLPGQSSASKAPAAESTPPDPSTASSVAWSSGPASTAGLRMQDDIANKKMKSNSEESAQTIELNNTTNEADEAEKKNREALALAAEAAAKAKASKEEPNLFFTISSIAALVFVCFMTYILASLYFNTWKETKLPVIIFQQVSDLAGKK